MSSEAPREKIVAQNPRRKQGTGRSGAFNARIYMRNVVTRKVRIPFTNVGSNIKEIIQTKLQRSLEGKCAKEGYVKSGSITVIGYSAGVVKGKFILFDVVFEALICRPVEGMNIRCVVKNVTKAGVRAETKGEKSPVVIFIARDHQYQSKAFSDLSQGEEVTVRVIGIRYELNDEYISVIAELVEKKAIPVKGKIKIRIGKQ